MSLKIDRISSSFMKEISEIILEEVKDTSVKSITITDCQVTNDLSYAKVYFTSYKDKADVLKRLEKASGFIRTKLAERVNLRHTPKLIFVFDESIEYAKKIEKIIDDMNN